MVGLDSCVGAGWGRPYPVVPSRAANLAPTPDSPTRDWWWLVRHTAGSGSARAPPRCRFLLQETGNADGKFWRVGPAWPPFPSWCPPISQAQPRDWEADLAGSGNTSWGAAGGAQSQSRVPQRTVQSQAHLYLLLPWPTRHNLACLGAFLGKLLFTHQNPPWGPKR